MISMPEQEKQPEQQRAKQGGFLPLSRWLRAFAIRLLHRSERAQRLYWRLRSKPSEKAEFRPNPISRDAFRAKCAAALAEFFASGERLRLPCSEQPAVSILLVVFNQAPLTLACLRSVAATVELPAEVIIVDNHSTDETEALLSRLDGARIVRNDENRHFLHGVNQAAALAKGQALLLLNNDATLRPGSLQAAWEALQAFPDVGAVGGPIVLPSGALQEAGSIIFSDGSALGYGRGRDPRAGEFQFRREVDYCSGAFLLIRRAVFEALGGFDPAFAPAYYEETDFCMRMRAKGWRVLYEPRAVIDHFEFGSAASPEAAIALQERNRALFCARHEAALASAHPAPGTDPLYARMRQAQRGRVLVIDDRVPEAWHGGGAPRAAALVSAIRANGWFVTFYPLQFPDAPSRASALPDDVEVMPRLGPLGLRQFLRERAHYYDVILISRPHNMRLFRFLRPRGLSARIVYDAEALFAWREAGQARVQGKPLSRSRWRALLNRELGLAKSADAVITVSAREARFFRAVLGAGKVHILGHALALRPTPRPFTERAHFLFVGSLNNPTDPNADSLIWFASEVMPKLDRLLGTDYELWVAGRCDPSVREALAFRPRIRVLGQVGDLFPLYDQARVFVAPTRFAAGIPHKVHEAAAHGLPAAVTPLLAAQLGWRSGCELLQGDTTSAFAAACARLYSDGALWQKLRTEALRRVAADCDPIRFHRTVGRLMEALTADARCKGAVEPEAESRVEQLPERPPFPATPDPSGMERKFRQT